MTFHFIVNSRHAKLKHLDAMHIDLNEKPAISSSSSRAADSHPSASCLGQHPAISPAISCQHWAAVSSTRTSKLSNSSRDCADPQSIPEATTHLSQPPRDPCTNGTASRKTAVVASVCLLLFLLNIYRDVKGLVYGHLKTKVCIQIRPKTESRNSAGFEDCPSQPTQHTQAPQPTYTAHSVAPARLHRTLSRSSPSIQHTQFKPTEHVVTTQ